MNKKDTIKRLLSLTEEEIIEVLEGKDDHSVFAIYITALDFHDYAHYVFKDHNMNMKTLLPRNRKVDDCESLYKVLLRTPFRMQEDRDLFRFIRNSLILNRDLKEGELL